jgi:hypothetical protein
MGQNIAGASAFPPKADIDGYSPNVRFVPKADIKIALSAIPASLSGVRRDVADYCKVFNSIDVA